MGFEVLRSKKGGYVKNDVIMKLDALNALILALENGMPREQAYAELKKTEQIVLRKEKGGLFGASGFDTGDTDAYIADLTAKIEDLIR
ncbi:MAG: hypothetical protein IKW96_01895 [Ruminococcus sp.]|uniref:hypothetical protein n=1 Tax=Ruminococcus sp. TaxID=41978 RepID=UPI0025DBDDFD|nr:hypothetical protein [Ruminococcus sp.]MBR5682021.1 hypothetical protein [Ruminococcus sp.]